MYKNVLCFLIMLLSAIIMKSLFVIWHEFGNISSISILKEMLEQ